MEIELWNQNNTRQGWHQTDGKSNSRYFYLKDNPYFFTNKNSNQGKLGDFPTFGNSEGAAPKDGGNTISLTTPAVVGTICVVSGLVLIVLVVVLKSRKSEEKKRLLPESFSMSYTEI